ncbi:MAG: hypothetical protein EPO11_04275 [Gammaproteobacteria bacterium]|nr:MAG: hypothetical protein EPO11_04275 [Gammaproteobacteria bacterium]
MISREESGDKDYIVGLEKRRRTIQIDEYLPSEEDRAEQKEKYGYCQIKGAVGGVGSKSHNTEQKDAISITLFPEKHEHSFVGLKKVLSSTRKTLDWKDTSLYALFTQIDPETFQFTSSLAEMGVMGFAGYVIIGKDKIIQSGKFKQGVHCIKVQEEDRVFAIIASEGFAAKGYYTPPPKLAEIAKIVWDARDMYHADIAGQLVSRAYNQGRGSSDNISVIVLEVTTQFAEIMMAKHKTAQLSEKIIQDFKTTLDKNFKHFNLSNKLSTYIKRSDKLLFFSEIEKKEKEETLMLWYGEGKISLSHYVTALSDVPLVDEKIDPITEVNKIAMHPFWQGMGVKFASSFFGVKNPDGILAIREESSMDEYMKIASARTKSKFYRSPIATDFYELILVLGNIGISEPIRASALRAFKHKWSEDKMYKMDKHETERNFHWRK